MKFLFSNRLFLLIYLAALLLTSACQHAQSFRSFKQKLVSRTDEVVVTFYDSRTMNAETLEKLTSFTVDNSAEVSRFRRFIKKLRARSEDCRSDGTLVFVNSEQQLQHMEFNLTNRCVTLYPAQIDETDTDGEGESVAEETAQPEHHRLSRRGTAFLEQLREGTGDGAAEKIPSR